MAQPEAQLSNTLNILRKNSELYTTAANESEHQVEQASLVVASALFAGIASLLDGLDAIAQKNR